MSKIVVFAFVSIIQCVEFLWKDDDIFAILKLVLTSSFLSFVIQTTTSSIVAIQESMHEFLKPTIGYERRYAENQTTSAVI